MIAEAGLDHFALAKSGRESRLPLLFAKVSKNGPQKKKKKAAQNDFYFAKFI